ncbi:magnesium and cobalt transport protein CorA [Methylobacter tundripaludum]|jgi:CorA-like Mg2+ transporter protein.|uniref:MgtE intracellular region n=1 Tax=Methylobacter tundripaludum (strain ATCC BAA-1195 / DSM 17260 / SV96) TaxID=697282 RepID=G3IRQ6_METTV|nr:magnesium and cobalt transport protein CorA [Methylobacter tundripaludum]EGW23749.1 MgtE intracellular region [Methylobacter tundripaludum SV96]
MQKEPAAKYYNSHQAVLDLLQKHKLIADLVHKQDMPHHGLVEALVRKENMAQLQQILNHLPPSEIAHILEELPPEDQLLIWEHLDDDHKQPILLEAPISVLQILGKQDYKTEKSRVKAFNLHEGRLHEISINTPQDLLEAKPIWIDLVAPTFEDRIWVGDIFGIEIPDPDKLSDLESSARFYVEENGEIHLHSDFLLDKDDVSRNVAVAFILYRDILFSIRKEELPIFRLQRLRALSQPNYVSDSRDMLLDLYAANAEYSADALEEVYLALEVVGNQVLSKQISDEDAAKILINIANEEDLNGRIRRNVMDTRRAVSFLMRSKILAKNQLEDSQQILRDIESLDGHTAFLFDKINFLMDASVGFININQNKVVKRLTVVSVVFMPLNVLAGIGGMSEFSMMTQGIAWPVSYSIFTIGLVVVGWLTFAILRFLEKREHGKSGKR